MIEKFFLSLEMAPMNITSWLGGFLGVIWLRYLLEAFSSPNVSGYLPSDLPTLVHYTIFYLAVVVSLVVVVSIVAKLPPLRMLRAAIFLLPIIWIAPLIDLTYGGARMTYLFATTPSDLLMDFFTYFGPLTRVGVTFGLRIEIGVLLLILGMYVYVHKKRLLRALGAVLSGYIVLFTLGSLPTILSFFLPISTVNSNFFLALESSFVAHTFLHPTEMYSTYRTFELLFDAILAQTLYIILCLSAGIFVYLVRKDVMRAIVKNIRPERLAHYLIVAFLGGIIAFSNGSKIDGTLFNSITVIVAILTIIFACLFAITTNDIADERIDNVSNTDRPLVTGALSHSMMQEIARVCGLLALAGALTLGSYATFWILIFSATYYVYSVPPLRLKRIPLFASLLIGIATLALMLFGFFLVSTNQMLTAFPKTIAILVVLFIALVSNIRDLKDIEGDAVEGIKTIPTLLGDRYARMVIGAMTFIACMLVPVFFSVKALWIPSFVAGSVSWIGLVRGKGERFLFSLYFIYLAIIVFILTSIFI